MVKQLTDFLNVFQETAIGRILTAAVYAAMLILVLMFFTGNGQFIYEV
ncbi:MAG: hypothetical protein ACI4DV_03275 [Lachnospiraceae bacterium]